MMPEHEGQTKESFKCNKSEEDINISNWFENFAHCSKMIAYDIFVRLTHAAAGDCQTKIEQMVGAD